MSGTATKEAWDTAAMASMFREFVEDQFVVTDEESKMSSRSSGSIFLRPVPEGRRDRQR